MKKSIVGLVGSIFVTTQAFGAFTPTQLISASQIAIADFEVANPDHAVHFTGFKSWKTGEDAKVKIYVDHDGHAMEFNYLCHKHDNELECHAN